VANEIRKVREAIARDLASARLCPEDRHTELSPCGRYELEINGYATSNAPNYATIAVAVIRGVATGEIIATIMRNDDRCFFAWVTRDGHDYFLLPEDLEGQTVIDLSSRRVEGYSSQDDRFIWTEFHPSPDRTKLAIVGCYWACPYQITVYDFREPLTLPLPTIARFDLPGNDGKFGAWLSADSFTVLDRHGDVRVFDLS
jgi:hypothetical protein